jgi:hypothetical protein
VNGDYWDFAPAAGSDSVLAMHLLNVYRQIPALHNVLREHLCREVRFAIDLPVGID